MSLPKTENQRIVTHFMHEIPSSEELRQAPLFGELQRDIHAVTSSETVLEMLFERAEGDHEENLLETHQPEHIVPGLGASEKGEADATPALWIQGYIGPNGTYTTHPPLTSNRKETDLLSVSFRTPGRITLEIFKTLGEQQQLFWLQYAFALRHDGLSEKLEKSLKTGRGNLLGTQDRIFALKDSYARIMGELLPTQTD